MRLKILFVVLLIVSYEICAKDIYLSQRKGEYVDKAGRKVIIDAFGYGIFEEKGIQSLKFDIGTLRSVETNYKVIINHDGRIYYNTFLIFTSEDECMLIFNYYLKYYFRK